MNEFKLHVFYKTKPGCREDFIKEVSDSGIADKIRQEDGCIAYDYYLSVADENSILLIEIWSDQAHQEQHMAHPNMTVLKSIKDKYIDTTTLIRYYED